MVALVRGVHGLNGAVRVEVLTDRPEDRFVAGRVLYREGDDRPLTIASAEAVADGPGWRLRFREVTTRDGADALRGAYLETVVQPDDDLARGDVLLARGHRLRGARRRRHRARHGPGHLPGRRDRGLRRRRRRRSATSTCRRSARSSGSSRRGAARSSSTPSRSTCGRARRADPDRPKAPRRRSRSQPAERRAAERYRTPRRATPMRPRRRRQPSEP